MDEKHSVLFQKLLIELTFEKMVENTSSSIVVKVCVQYEYYGMLTNQKNHLLNIL